MVTREFRIKMILELTKSLVSAELAGDSKAFFTILKELTKEVKLIDQRRPKNVIRIQK